MSYLDTLPVELSQLIISYLPLEWDYEYIQIGCGRRFYTIYHQTFIKREQPELASITQQRRKVTPCICYERIALREWKNKHIGRSTPPFGGGPCLASDVVCVTKQLANCRRTWPQRFVF